MTLIRNFALILASKFDNKRPKRKKELSSLKTSRVITLIMIVVYGVIAVVALIYLWFKKKYSFWESHGFPSIPGKIPLGSVGEMGFKTHSSYVLKKFYDEYKGKAPAFGIYFMTQPVLIPTEPELVKDILVRNFESFHDRGFYFNEKDDPLSGHLVVIAEKLRNVMILR
jgi:hypothetical protein